MADNSTRLDAAQSTETIAADEIGGVKHQRVKIALGPDGTWDGDADGDLVNADAMTSGNLALKTMDHGYVFNGTTWDRVRGRSAIEGSSSEVGVPGVSPFMRDSAGVHRTIRPGDADGMAAAYLQGVTPMLYNGATADRERGNEPLATGLASAARTASTLSAIFTNYNGRGVYARLLATVQGTSTVQLRLLTLSSGVLIAETTASASTVLELCVYPGITEAAGTLRFASRVVPREFQFHVIKGDASSWTFAVEYYVIL